MAIKSFVRKLFTQVQWDWLAKNKRDVLAARTVLVERLARSLSASEQLDLRSRLQLKGRLDYQPAEILLYVDSPVEFQTRLYSCSKEPEMVKWIEECFGQGEVFFDIGANVGAYALLAAKVHGRSIQVYAFEPAFANFAQLCKNISLNNCQDNLVPLQVGLSDKTSLVDFNFSHIGSGSALHALGEPIDQTGEAFTPFLRLPVISFRLDDMLKQFGLPVPNHIKIDVDGIELEILKGAEEILANPRVKDLMIEVEEDVDSTQDLVEFLKTKGFYVKEKYRYLLGDTGKYAQTYNYLFVKGKR